MKKLALLTLLTIVLQPLFAQPKNSDVAKIMKQAFGSALKGYTVYSYPTNNFGVGTVCTIRWVPKGVMICDMIDTYGLSKINGSSALWETVNGYAHKGDGGPVTIQDSVVRSYGAGLLLPSILSALNINLSGYKVKNTSVSLTIDSAMVRHLNFDKFKELVNSGKLKTLQQVVGQKKAILVTSDFVLFKYKIEVRTTDSSGMEIAAKLDTALKNAKILSKGDSLGLKISKESNGVYTLQSSRPVIFAVLIKKQRNTGVLSADTNFDNWVSVKEEMLDPTEFLKQPNNLGN
jgi:hypothetical protein